MAYTTVPKSSAYFTPKLITGNGGTQNITGLNFQPDFTWIKGRDVAENHALFDAPRGVTKRLMSDTTGLELVVQGVTAFNSDGFTLGALSAVNQNNGLFASWNWKANGAGSSNTDGTINTIKTSANTTSGFSISTYTGTGANATVGHGLGVAPKFIIIKKYSSVANWRLYHASLGATKNLVFATDGIQTTPTMWNNTAPTSTTFSLGSYNEVNDSGANHVAYCFADVQGFSKAGSYTGNGSATSPTFIYLGFKPSFVLIKNVSQEDAWFLHDSKRDGFNDDNEYLRPNLADAESSGTNRIRLLSNGFSVPTTDRSHNVSGNVYIYMAFAKNPFVTSTGIPATAR